MLRSRMTMNCATQHTPSSHGETSRRALSGCGADEATAGGAVVSTLIATRTPQPAHRTAGRVGHRAHGQEPRARPMKRTPLIAMLTVGAAIASTVSAAGCGAQPSG